LTGKEEALFLLVVGALLIGATAFAQDGGSAFAVKGGVYWPTDSNVKDIGKTWLYGELDYTFSRNFDKNYDWHVQVGYMTKDGTWGEGEGAEDVSLRVIPVLVGVQWNQPATGPGLGYWYFGVGAGIAWGTADVDGNSDDKSVFAGDVYVGYQFNENWFVEGKYLMTADYSAGEDNVNGNGFMALVGYKFNTK
jgi:hypothetical protein